MNRLALALLLAASAPAAAHVTIASGPAVSNATNVVTFQIAHGCPADISGDPNLDTFALSIDIPAGVTSVRVVPSAFGKASVTKDGAGAVTQVAWTKSAADALASDDDFYTMSVRLKVPEKPFGQIYFTAHQTCKRADGTTKVVDWIALPGDTTGAEPAAALTILPARLPGWNKYTIGESTHLADADFGTYFADAQILWRGTAAFSINPLTATMIAMTTGVTTLSGGIHPGDEIWVKY